MIADCGGGWNNKAGARAFREVVDVFAEGEGLAKCTLQIQKFLNKRMAMAALDLQRAVTYLGAIQVLPAKKE